MKGIARQLLCQGSSPTPAIRLPLSDLSTPTRRHPHPMVQPPRLHRRSLLAPQLPIRTGREPKPHQSMSRTSSSGIATSMKLASQSPRMPFLKWCIAKRCKRPCGSGVSALARAVLLGLSEEIRRKAAVSYENRRCTDMIDAALVCDKSARQTSRSLSSRVDTFINCVRLQVVVVVNDGPAGGALRPVPDNGTPLTREEVVARAETFAAGPMPSPNAQT